jgi:hypothetical protein
VEVNSRDAAAVIGIALLALFLWRQHALGGIATTLLVVLLGRPMVWLWLVLIAWFSLLVLSAERIGLWEPSMLHDTALSLVPAGSLLLGATTAASTEGWYRMRVVRAIKLTVFVEVIVGLVTYNLVAEVLLLIVLSLAGGIATLAGSSHDTTGGVAPRWANRVLILGGLILIGGPILYLAQNAATIDWGILGRGLFQPVWLTILTLPLAFYMSLVATWESAMGQLRWWAAPAKPTWRHRVALVVGYSVHPRLLNRFIYNGNGMHELIQSRTFGEAIEVVRRPPPLARAYRGDEDDDEDGPAVPATPRAVAPRRRKRQRPHGRRRSH